METAFDELAQPDRRADVIGINALPQHLSSCVSFPVHTRKFLSKQVPFDRNLTGFFKTLFFPKTVVQFISNSKLILLQYTMSAPTHSLPAVFLHFELLQSLFPRLKNRRQILYYIRHKTFHPDSH